MDLGQFCPEVGFDGVVLAWAAPWMASASSLGCAGIVVI